MQFDVLMRIVRERASERSFSVVADSRKVKSGDIFVAIRGNSADGGQFIEAAIKAGASYIVCHNEDVVPTTDTDTENTDPHTGTVTVVRHESTRTALWQLAEAYYDTRVRFHEQGIRIVGITGTNGKTTTSYVLEHLFASTGKRVAVLGTVSYRWVRADGSRYEEVAPLTTPDALVVHDMLSRMADDGVDIVLMEVSSHALEQERVGGLDFSGAIFTNLTQDHLDFHGDMEQYFAAKARLFTGLPLREKVMAVNVDDAYGQRLVKVCPSAVGFTLTPKQAPEKAATQATQGHLSKSASASSPLCPSHIARGAVHGTVRSMSPAGMHLHMQWGDASWDLHSPLVGEFNASNLLAAQALALSMGCTVEQMQHLASFGGVCGRLERVVAGKNVFVDYAHTPDALVNVLQSLRSAGFAKIIAVFGCGGNRDRTKRPLMGEAVAKYADVAVLTSDNPRFEDPQAIIDDVLPGVQGAASLYVEVDRRAATQRALALLAQESAKSGVADVAVLIAGKGHEDYQIIEGVKHPYSDQETVRELL